LFLLASSWNSGTSSKVTGGGAGEGKRAVWPAEVLSADAERLSTGGPFGVFPIGLGEDGAVKWGLEKKQNGF